MSKMGAEMNEGALFAAQNLLGPFECEAAFFSRVALVDARRDAAICAVLSRLFTVQMVVQCPAPCVGSARRVE